MWPLSVWVGQGAERGRLQRELVRELEPARLDGGRREHLQPGSAHPTGERWSEHATPTFGGVGIFLGLAAGIVAATAVGGFHGREELLGILGDAALLFLAGIVDDVYSLPAIV